MALLRVEPYIVDSVGNFVFNTATITSNLTSGNASLGNLASATYISGTLITNAQPNITSVGSLASLTVTGLTTATGGVKTANIQDVSGTVTLQTKYGTNAGDVGITGNLVVGTGGAGNVTASYLIGNGSQLTGLPASYANANVTDYLPTYTGNLSPGNISVTSHSNLGSISNIYISGGSANYVLTTDGTGNLSWQAGGASSIITVDNFTGDGTTTNFTLAVSPANVNMITVNYNGIVLMRNSYSISGTTLTLATAPNSGAKVEVISITSLAGSGGGSSVSNVSIRAQAMTMGIIFGG